MATVSAAFPCKSANPSAPQRGTTPTKITLAPLIHPAFPFENDQASQRLALNPHKPRHHRRTQTTPRFPPSRLFGRLPPCIRSRLRTAGVRKPLTKPDLRAILVGLPHPTFAALQDRAYERAGSARKRPSAEGVASYPPFGMSLYIRPPFMIIARLVSGFSRSAMSAIGSPLTTRRSARASFSTTPSFPG